MPGRTKPETHSSRPRLDQLAAPLQQRDTLVERQLGHLILNAESGQYRVQAPMLVLREQAQEVGQLAFGEAFDIARVQAVLDLHQKHILAADRDQVVFFLDLVAATRDVAVNVLERPIMARNSSLVITLCL